MDVVRRGRLGPLHDHLMSPIRPGQRSLYDLESSGSKLAEWWPTAGRQFDPTGCRPFPKRFVTSSVVGNRLATVLAKIVGNRSATDPQPITDRLPTTAFVSMSQGGRKVLVIRRSQAKAGRCETGVLERFHFVCIEERNISYPY